MKMIKAIIRTEKEEAVMNNLEEAGLYAVTKIPVLGRGKQRGIQIGAVSYETLSKLMLILFVDENDCQKTIAAIEQGAHTGYPGDGKIFVQNVSKSYNIRTGKEAGA